jgi:hypothetical protein
VYDDDDDDDDDDALAGRPSTVACAKVKEQIDQCIWDNQRIVRTAFKMNMSHGQKRCKSGCR